jgi:hypothetical protein
MASTEDKAGDQALAQQILPSCNGKHAPNCHFAFHADRHKFVATLLEAFARAAA